MTTTDYGSDLTTFAKGITSGAGGLDPAFRIITGPRVVIEAVVRRWITPRGSLVTDRNALTIDIRQILGQGLTQSQVNMLGPMLAKVAVGDERVLDAQVLPTYDFPSKTLTISATIVLADGPFSFVVSASAQAVLITQASA